MPNSFIKLGKGAKSRIIDIQSIRSSILQNVQPEFLPALIGIHAFTGCDTISSFAGKGKIKALKLLIQYPQFVSYFFELGRRWVVTEDMVNNYVEFVCSLYRKPMKGIDLLRYLLYCEKGGKVDPDALPPCKATLSLHINRANYQAAIWRRATMSLPVIPPPSNHGWIIDNDTDVISVRWLKTKPAPEEILDLLSCICKKCCKVDSCCCM